MRLEPVDVLKVARRVADHAIRLADPHADVGGLRCARVAVDGAVPADTALVADAIGEAVREAGRPVVRGSTGDYLRPRSVRLEHGPDDPDVGYERWVDHLALRRELLDPLGPGGDLTYLPTFWDPESDRSPRATPVRALPGSVAVVDGPFLLRWETADAFDVSVHLLVSDAALARRLPRSDVVRVTGAWRRYAEETWPEERADVVLRFDRPSHPARVLTA
ncbi:MAG: uridine kinase [Actinomycetes bacterium]